MVGVFTGLVQDLGTIGAAERDGDGTRLVIATALAREIVEGDSVAVDGVCLTATAVDREAGSFAVDVMHETLMRSARGRLMLAPAAAWLKQITCSIFRIRSAASCLERLLPPKICASIVRTRLPDVRSCASVSGRSTAVMLRHLARVGYGANCQSSLTTC